MFLPAPPRIPPTVPLLLALLAVVPRATPQPYSDWAAGNFTAADCAAGKAAPGNDPDHDRWPNLLEYALATDPGDPHSRPQPSFQTDPAGATCNLPPGSTDAGLRLMISGNLTDWQPATSVSTDQHTVSASLGTCRFLRLEAVILPGVPLDSDGDGLHDIFEEQIAAEFPEDPLDNIGDVDPLDDFDGDGIPNIDEAANQHPAGCGFPAVPVLDPADVAAAADTVIPAPSRLSVHTPLN